MLSGNWAAWQVLDDFTRPFLTLYSDQDAVAPEEWRPFVARVPGAVGQPHTILAGGGHFLQEDVPAAYTDVLVSWLKEIDA